MKKCQPPVPAQVDPEPTGFVQPPGLSIALVLEPKSCINAEKNDSTVKMKEFTAGSKAKTVQLADFKCLVCPLDVQTEKLLPSYDVCVAREQTIVASPRPLVATQRQIGFRRQGRLGAPPRGADQAPA